MTEFSSIAHLVFGSTFSQNTINTMEVTNDENVDMDIPDQTQEFVGEQRDESQDSNEQEQDPPESHKSSKASKKRKGQVPPQLKAKGISKKGIRKSVRAGITFPVGKLTNLLRRKSKRVAEDSGIYLAAVLEFLNKEVVNGCIPLMKKAAPTKAEKESKVVNPNRRRRLSPRVIMLAASNDKDLKSLLNQNTVVFVGTGVNPTAQIEFERDKAFKKELQEILHPKRKKKAENDDESDEENDPDHQPAENEGSDSDSSESEQELEPKKTKKRYDKTKKSKAKEKEEESDKKKKKDKKKKSKDSESSSSKEKKDKKKDKKKKKSKSNPSDE